MNGLRKEHDVSYANVTDHAPGTRLHYQFVSSKQNRVGTKRCSSHDAPEYIHDFSVFLIYVQDISNGQCAAVMDAKVWWTALDTENLEEVKDGKVKSMHSKVPSKF